MIELIRYTDANHFLSENQHLLEEQEALNSLLLGLTLARKDEEDGSLFLALKTKEGIGLSALQTPGRSLIVAGNASKFKGEAFGAILADYFIADHHPLPGIIGPKDLALPLGNLLVDRLGLTLEVTFKQLVYELRTVEYSPKLTGQLRKATHKDFDQIAAWMHGFLKEAMHEDDKVLAEATALKKIDKGEVFFWEDDTAIAMSCIGRPTHHGISVSYVFTPKEQRGKGYGTQLVASLSQLMLARGYQFCTLFTDLENPTSNSIYRKIGYEPVGEFRAITFKPS